MGVSGGGGGGDGGAGQARADEQARQAKIREGTTRVNSIFDSQFNDDFFGRRQQSYLDYATPQLNDQYADARKQLTFALDRSGTLDSSVRAAKEAELQKLYDTNRRSVADEALGYGTKSKSSIEDARANLIQTLNSTADTEGAVNAAINRSKVLSQEEAYRPLGQLFSSFTGTLGQQAAADKAAALSSSFSTPNGAGLFNNTKKSVVTT
jgi:hypothetical protein